MVAVNWAQFALVIGPSVPDRGVFGELVVDIGGAAEEPEEFAEDGVEAYFFRGDHREAVAEVVFFLDAEDGNGAGAGAVGFSFAVVEDFFN